MPSMNTPSVAIKANSVTPASGAAVRPANEPQPARSPSLPGPLQMTVPVPLSVVLAAVFGAGFLAGRLGRRI